MSGFFGELYLRSTLPFLTPERTAAEVAYLARAFAPATPPGPVLDIGCGHGRHLAGLTRALPHRPLIGVELDGASLAQCPPGLSLVRGDFLRMPFRGASAAGAYAWYSTLFIGDDDHNRGALEACVRVLRPGALFVLQTLPFRRIADNPRAVFHRTLPDGSALHEDNTFNPQTGRDEGFRTLTTPEGRVLSAPYAIRYYPEPDLIRLLEQVGLKVAWLHGDLDGGPLNSNSTDLMVGARKDG